MFVPSLSWHTIDFHHMRGGFNVCFLSLAGRRLAGQVYGAVMSGEWEKMAESTRKKTDALMNGAWSLLCDRDAHSSSSWLAAANTWETVHGGAVRAEAAMSTVRKRLSFKVIYILKMLILPRQARDRHRETTQKRDRFVAAGNCSAGSRPPQCPRRREYLTCCLLHE